MKVKSNNTFIREIVILVVAQLIGTFFIEAFKKNKIQIIYYLIPGGIVLVILIIKRIIEFYLKKNKKYPLPKHSATKLIEESAFPRKTNSLTSEWVKEMIRDRQESKRHEFDIIQRQVDEVKQHFKNFSFLTEYDELHNCRGIPWSPVCVSNNDGDAIRRFFKYVKNLLTNNLNSNHKGPLQNDSFNIYFPPETSKIANDIKIILNKFLKTIDFIKRSISYKQKNQNIIHILDVLADDIRESLLNHEGILLSITDDLFPRAIQLCNEKKVFPINNLTTFLEGLIEIKSKFVELRNRIDGDIVKANENPTPD